MPEYCDSHPTVLVTGATGAIGGTLVESLIARGITVRALVRPTTASRAFSSSIEVVTGDITEPRSVARAVEGVSAVYHLAAKLHVPNPAPEMRAEYDRVNVEGTRVLVEAAQSAGVQRLVFFSTISVYGPTGIHSVDEESPPNPDTIYAETKLQAEETVLSARDLCSGKPLAVVLRMAAVYGPRMKGNYLTLINSLRMGRFIPVGNGENLRTLIYERDAVRAAILSGQHPEAAGRIYNVSDGANHTLHEITAAICAAMDRRPPQLYIPVGLAHLVARTADYALRLGGGMPRLTAAVDKFTETVAVKAERIRQELGFHPEYDLKRGWEETIAGLSRGNAR